MNALVLAIALTIATSLGYMLRTRMDRRNFEAEEAFEHEFIGTVTGVCMRNNVIDNDQAEMLLTVWWNYREFLAGHFSDCACGAVKVHCEDDEQTINGMKHTIKFCDIAEKSA